MVAVDYVTPPETQHCIRQPPELLAADLYRCTGAKGETYTIEDKDPSVLWRLNSTNILDYWHGLSKQRPDRWAVAGHPEEQVLQ